MDETTTPLESGLAWTVALEPADRKFIGREVLDKQKAAGVPRQLVGLVLEGKGVLRNHQKVQCHGAGEGEITSGSFSPTLNQAVALARVPAAVKLGDRCTVDLRGKAANTRVVKYPFVRNGKSCLT
jgi:aminomethyltransferase